MVLSGQPLQAQTLYWDLNGTTAGAGTTPTGNWNTAGATNWNPLADGTGIVVNWTAGNNAVFSAGTNATGIYTVTLGAAMNVGDMTFEEGTATITGSTLNLTGASGSTIDVASGLTAQIDSLLGGSAVLNKTGAGTLVLGSTTFNSHTGDVNVNAGTLRVAKVGAVGAIDNAADVTIAAGATLSFNSASATYNIETVGSLAGAGNLEHLGAATPFTLKISGAANTTFSGVISDGANNLNLEKNTGTGTLTLSGANAYDGTTLISAGTINIQHATALGSTTGGTTVASGAALEIQNNIAVGAETLSLAGTGVSSNGALRNVSGTNSYAGNLTLTAATEIQSDAGSLALSGSITAANFGLTVDGAGNTTASGVLALGSGTLTRNGNGTLYLTGAGNNTYTGLTTINAGGAINIQKAQALGTTGAGTTVNSGGALEIEGGITTTAEALTLNGTGVSGNGALRNISGANTYAGNITLANASEIQSDAGTLTLSGTIGGATQALTVDGSGNTTINGAIGTTSGTLTKNGSGLLTLGANNTYTGGTTINAGTVRVSADLRLGAAPGAATPNNVVFNGGTLETTATFTLAANRGVTVNAGGGTVDVNAGTTLTYGGILTGAGALTKSDTGTLLLNGTTTNTHTGDINVNAGTLQIGKTGGANRAIGDSATVTVATGATLAFTGGQSETFGALAGGGTVNNSNASAITVTMGTSGPANFSGVIQDSGGNLTLTKTGTGTQTLSGTTANTFAGNLNVNDGTLALGKTAGVNAYAGATINIGDGAGLADTAVLQLATSNQIVNTAALVFASDGRLDLNGQTETVASISGTGEILVGTGQLTVSSGSFTGQLTGTTGTFIKTGAGTLSLGATFDYDGIFELNAGTLQFNGVGMTANIGTLNLTGNSTIDFSSNATLLVDTLNLNGFTLSILNWTNASDYFFATNWTGATQDLTGSAPMNQVAFTGFTSPNTTKWQSYDNQVTPVPEPSTYGALLLGGLTGIFAWRRLVRRSARHAGVAPRL